MNTRFSKKRLRYCLWAVAAFVAVYTIAGFLLVPMVGKKMMIKSLGKTLDRNVKIESVFVNPFALTLEINGFALEKKNKTKSEPQNFIALQTAFANLSIASLFKLSPVVTELTIKDPEINLVLNQDNTFNFSDLIKDEKKESKHGPNQGFFKFLLYNASIINGKIHFSDQIRQTDHDLEKLNIVLPFLSSIETDQKALMKIDFLLNQAKMDLALESQPFSQSLTSTLKIKTSKIDLLKYLGYFPVPQNIAIKNIGLDLDLAAVYSSKDSAPSLVLEGTAKFDELKVQDSDNSPIFEAAGLVVKILPSDLWQNKLSLGSVELLSPQLNLSRDVKGDINIASYLPRDNSKNLGVNQAFPNRDEKVGNSNFEFSLALGQVKDGTLFFTDAGNKTLFKTTLSDLNIQVKDLVSRQGITGNYSFSLNTEAKEKLSSEGRFATLPMVFDCVVKASGLDLNKYSPYYQDLVNFDIHKGDLSFETGVLISRQNQADQLGFIINNRLTHIQDLKLKDRINKDFPVIVDDLKITDSVIDSEKLKIQVGKIVASKGQLLVKRQADGSFNLKDNLISSSKKNIDHTDKAEAVKIQKSGKPWQISLDSLALDSYSLLFEDLTTKDPVSVDLSDIVIKASNFYTLGTQKAQVEAGMSWNQDGKIRVKGEIVPSLSTAGLDIDLEKIDIRSFSPYFADQVRVIVTSGRVNTQGRLDLFLDEKPDPRILFAGKTAVADFICLDKQSANDFLKFHSFYISGLDLELFPVKVEARGISLTDFYSRVIISDTGDINLGQIFNTRNDKPGQTVEPAGVDQEAAPQITVSDITLQNGHIKFSDYLTKPNFTAEMKEISGSVKGLSSMDINPAQLTLKGVHGNSSPLDIAGRISPLTREKFADIDVSFKDIELAKFSPYSSKYIGYKIEKGKLILDLNYKIKGKKLDSRNRLLFDKLTLGERVDSKDATSLPVGFAISLLKDTEDQIDLDLPITGDLDDPEFRVGSVLVEMIKNLIIKAVSAPFAILGSMFENGEQLGFVDFAYGRDDIDLENIKKIDQLINILDKKKSLKLEIEGYYDQTRDSQALGHIFYENLLKSIKLVNSKNKKLKSLEDVVIMAEEREGYILAAWENAKFSKPRKKDGKKKAVTISEMEKLLITNMTVEDSDLRNLAMARAEKIKAYILSTNRVEKERLFLLDPNLDDRKSDGYGKVRFSLKQ